MPRSSTSLVLTTLSPRQKSFPKSTARSQAHHLHPKRLLRLPLATLPLIRLTLLRPRQPVPTSLHLCPDTARRLHIRIPATSPTIPAATPNAATSAATTATTIPPTTAAATATVPVQPPQTPHLRPRRTPRLRQQHRQRLRLPLLRARAGLGLRYRTVIRAGAAATAIAESRREEGPH